jgi:hypothetical protein
MTSYIVPIIVVAALAWLMVSASRTAKRDGDVDVLTYSSAWKGLVRAMWIFPIVIALVGIFSPPAPGERWIPFAIIAGFAAICWPLTLEVFRRVIELSDAGISQRSAWSKPVTIAWKDVRDVAVKLSGEVEVKPARGRSARVSLYLSGLETFAEALEKHLAHLPATAGVVKKIRAHRV